MKNIPEILCLGGKTMFDRRLSDLAGGNISARDGTKVYMSPRYAGQHHHWDLTPEMLITGDWTDDKIADQPGFSREGWSHLYIYRCFPDAHAVVHAHPFNIMPFSAFHRSIEPVLEATEKFGIVGLCAPAPGHTKILAENVVSALRGKEEQMRTQAAAVLIPNHGIILAGKDFDNTLDALERIDENAYCLTVRRLLE